MVGADLLTLEYQKYILTFKDFYTRKIQCIPLNSKNGIEIKKGLEQILDKLGNPETLVTDPVLEFTNKTVKQLLADRNIAHHITSTDKSQSTGRIERLHRDIWQHLREEPMNNKDMDINCEIKSFTEKYNNCYYRGIKLIPEEAWKDPNKIKLKAINKENSKYANEFKIGNREKFEENQKIYIEDDKNKTKNKTSIKYPREGEIYTKLENDSYLIKINDRVLKRTHAQIVATLKSTP